MLVSIKSLFFSRADVPQQQPKEVLPTRSDAGHTTGAIVKALREEKNLSRGDIERRTGLLRVYVSRVENGHTVPAIETLEKFARALEVPMYQLFYEGEVPPAPTVSMGLADHGWGRSGRDVKTLRQFRRLMSRMSRGDLRLLLSAAQEMAQRKKRVPRRLKD